MERGGTVDLTPEKGEAMTENVDASDSYKSARVFDRYPEYKNSGSEWLGDVPSHWNLKKMAYVAKATSGGTPSKEHPEYWRGDIPWVSPKDMKRRVISDSIDHVSEVAIEETGLSMIDEPAVLIVVRGMILVHSFPAAFTAAPVTINQDMKALRLASDIDANFFVYLLAGMERFVLSLIEAAGHGTKKLRSDLWRAVELWLPELQEQRKIAEVLVREAGKIDGLVAKKEELIKLLQEKRTALITHAVTKGLDPTAPMKDSGIEWLGEIPAHWAIKKLKTVSSVQTGVTLGKKHERGGLESRPYLRVANVQDGYLDLEDIAEVELPATEVGRHELQPGDVLMTEGGDFDKLGRGYVWDGQIEGCLHQNHIFAVRPLRSRLHPHFLSAVLGSGYGRAYFTATSKQSTNLASTNSTKLGNLPVPLPSFDVQEQILGDISCKVDVIDDVTIRAVQGIKFLQELRSTLISAAVTGKIDVREEVA